MRAVVVDRLVSPDELRVREAPEPVVSPGGLLIDVHAAGVNFFDTLLVQGKYQLRPEFPFVPGGELSGIVREVGAGVEGFSPGERVMASVPYGAFAEVVCVRARAARRMPANLSFAQAAALPVVYLTAHAALVHRGALVAGETVLVTGAAGGVGIATIQIGKALGARCIGLVGSPDKAEVIRRAGADLAIDYTHEDWVERVRDATSGRGADVIVENVGGDVFDGCTRCIAWGGRIVVSGFASGKIPEIRVNRILLKQIAVVGLHIGPMLEHEPEKVEASWRAIESMLAAGALEPLLFKVFPLEEVAAALAALSSRESWGKLVLEIRAP
jgi:NADPH2:quinone reductase